METELTQRSLCLVNYPAVVGNTEKMIETLGGKSQLTKSFAQPQFRLSLTLDPGNKYAKPLFGDRQVVDNSLLIKVRVKRSKSRKKKPELLECSVVGVTSFCYDFISLADFQYLPLERNKCGKLLDIQKHMLCYDENAPFQSYEDFFSQDLPVAISPVVFSRFDRPVSFYYRKDQSAAGPEKSLKRRLPATAEDFVDHSNRRRRLNGTQYLRFNEQTVPTEICSAIANQSMTGRLRALSDQLAKLFEQKPCWLTKALCYEFRHSEQSQKILLKGSVQRHAYLCFTGPWARQWIRFGYDPRKDPSAKIHQTFDYRLPKRFRSIVMTDELAGSRKINKSAFGKTPAGTTLHSTAEEKMLTRKEISKADFAIYPDQLPPCYNIFTQLKDIHIDAVQYLIHKNDGSEESVTEIDGWLEIGTTDKIRRCVETAFRLLPEFQELETISKGVLEH